MKDKLDKNYWNDRYLNMDIPWDTGEITTPLKVYFDQLDLSGLSILIPGAGNAHEAEYLFRNGCKAVYVCDWAEKALELFRERVPDFPAGNLISGDFFEINLKFDRIIEQTFFCTLPPENREIYAKKVSKMLNPGGKIVGLMFKELPNPEGPPFGGKRTEYLKLFKKYFNNVYMEDCYNSIPPRSGNELFVIISDPKN